MYLCPAGCTGTVRVVILFSTFTLASAVRYGLLLHEVHSHWLLRMRAFTVSIEGYGQARNGAQRLAQGIPVLQRITSSNQLTQSCVENKHYSGN